MDKEDKKMWLTVYIIIWIIIGSIAILVFGGEFISHKFVMIQNKHNYQECTDKIEKGLPLPMYCWEF